MYRFLRRQVRSSGISKIPEFFFFFKNFPQVVVVHTVKGFGIVNKAEVDIFLELSLKEAIMMFTQLLEFFAF